MANLATLSVRATKELRRVHHAVLPLRLDCGYVSRTTTLRHANNNKQYPGQIPVMTLATPNRHKESPTPTNTGDRASNPQKLPTSTQPRSDRRVVAKRVVGDADELTIAFVAERSPVNANARHPLVAKAITASESSGRRKGIVRASSERSPRMLKGRALCRACLWTEYPRVGAGPARARPGFARRSSHMARRTAASGCRCTSEGLARHAAPESVPVTRNLTRSAPRRAVTE
jgi:hypothetical protein